MPGFTQTILFPAPTTVKRDEFKRMLADCEAGKIDIILNKEHLNGLPGTRWTSWNGAAI